MPSLGAALDAWGKIPSALFDGNLYEFGGFSECIHIKRNDVDYKSKYCLGQLQFNASQSSAPKSHRLENAIFPILVQSRDVSKIQPRDLTPK